MTETLEKTSKSEFSSSTIFLYIIKDMITCVPMLKQDFQDKKQNKLIHVYI